MAIKTRKPTSPGQRFTKTVLSEGLHKGRPVKSLTKGKKRISGRDGAGRISVRRRGGGHKRLQRVIDFRRNKDGVPALVHRIEYDPNRTARLALLKYLDGEWRYIIAPKGLRAGQKVVSGNTVEVEVGNCAPLRAIPVGTTVHCVEMKPGKGAQLARSAGASAQILGRTDDVVLLRLRSGEVRRVHSNCRASIGVVSNEEHSLASLGKAGRTRWKGRRPKVRGVAMNPIDHPHGGGEGRTSGGRHPVSPWGQPTKGYKTRNNPRTDKHIVRRRDEK